MLIGFSCLYLNNRILKTPCTGFGSPQHIFELVARNAAAQLSSSGLKSNNSPIFLLDINIDSPYICCAWRCSTTVVHQLCVLCILPPAKSSYCAVFGASHVLVVPGLALFVVAVGVNPCCPSPSIRVALDCLHVVVWSIAPPMMHLHLWGCCWRF